MLGLLFGASALERNLSLNSEAAAWSDAAEKIDLKAPPNAVGRSRPFLNLGAYYLGRGMIDQAEWNISKALALGDRGRLGASARFNWGVVLQVKKKHAEALQAFAEAEAQGYSDSPLYYHKGESQAAMGQLLPALESLGIAVDKAEKDPQQQRVVPTFRIRWVETAMAAQRYDEAINGFNVLLRTSPNDPRLRLGLGMARVGKGDTKAAIDVFDQLLETNPGAPVYYGRAIALHKAGQQMASLRDIDQAIKLDPRNSQYTQMRAIIAAPQK